MTNRHSSASLLALLFLSATLCASNRPAAQHHHDYHLLEPTKKASYTWQLDTTAGPLLQITGIPVYPSLQQEVTFPIGPINALILEPLTYDASTNEVLIPMIDEQENKGFARLGNGPRSETTTQIKLIDSPTSKTIVTNKGAKYLFVLLPNNEFRCVSVRHYQGISIDFLYTARDVLLHTISDSFGRSTTFNYSEQQLRSVTQTWTAEGEQISETWGSDTNNQTQLAALSKYAHSGIKLLPSNALVKKYSDAMETSDKYLASIFGGPSAVAAANGFEPNQLAASYPFYRGDIIGDDGLALKGHLSNAMHLYGSPDGTADSPIYLPIGFTSHSTQPTPVDAVVTFYYPQLGNLKDVTIAIFHIKNFTISQEERRVKIGEIGGPGGSSAQYKHAHIEFYKGNTGLPPPPIRPSLRIPPSTIFGPNHSPTVPTASIQP